MRQLPLDLFELLQRLRALEHENAHLRAAIRRALCGNCLNRETTCQLPRHHEGMHAWMTPTGDLMLRW